MEHAIIVGSAPCAENLRTADLSDFTRIAINKSWALRDDFQVHVGLKFMEEVHSPPESYTLKRVKRNQYGFHLNKAGGNFLCSPSVALIAGYWAINTKPYETITYYGCDLVFDAVKNGGRTHFYGVSDQGPLFNKHPSMKRQDLKSVRLFTWGLMHRVVLLNASAEKGTLLAYPTCSLSIDREQLFSDVMNANATRHILRQGRLAFEFEHETRTAAFSGRWGAFEKDPDAIERLTKMLEKWEPIKELCLSLNRELIG